jgi:hypothetical protein
MECDDDSLSEEDSDANNADLEEISSMDNSQTESTQSPLQKIFQQEDLGEILHDHTDFSKGDFLLDILEIYKDHKFSKRCLKRLLKLFDKYLPIGHLAPKTLYKFNQVAEKLRVNSGALEKKYFCNDCQLPLESVIDKSNKCIRCNSEFMACSVSKDLKAELKNLFELRGLSDAIISYKKESEENLRNGVFFDVLSGNICMGIKDKKEYDLQVLMNTDGFPAGSSTTKQVWPIFLSIANIHPNLRKEFLIVAKIWYSQSKPSMDNLLDDWVQAMVSLKNEGVDWVCPKTQKVMNSKISVVAAVADAHARAPIQNISLFNGEHGCNFCEIPGKQLKKSKRIYPFTSSKCKARSRARMVKQAKKLADIKITQYNAIKKRKRGDPVIKVIDRIMGVKGPSSLYMLPDFNIVDSFSPDYLHSLLLGLVKRHLLYITNSKNKSHDFYIGGVIVEVSKKLESIKVPSFINRLPRSLKSVKNWKGSEFLNWLLYYSLPCLKHAFKKEEYFQHWCLLVEGVYILCKDQITRENLLKANTLLRAFCSKYGELYGNSEETYNLHMLVHYANSVVNLGPLWATSTFIFEGANGILKRKIHGCNSNVAMELVNTYQLLETIHYLRCSLKRYTRVKTSDGELLGKSQFITADILSEANLDSVDDASYYLRARYKNLTYNGERYSRATKTNSNFVMFIDENGAIGSGKIMYFAKIGNANYFIARKVIYSSDCLDFYNTEFGFPISHIKKIQNIDEMVCLKLQCIYKPLISIFDEYLCEPANLVELNM